MLQKWTIGIPSMFHLCDGAIEKIHEILYEKSFVDFTSNKKLIQTHTKKMFKRNLAKRLKKVYLNVSLTVRDFDHLEFVRCLQADHS